MNASRKGPAVEGPAVEGQAVEGQAGDRGTPSTRPWGAILGGSLLLKQALFVAVVVAATAGILSLASYLISRQILAEQIQNHLITVARSRSERVKVYGDQQRERIRLVASRTQLRLLLGRPRVDGKLSPDDREQIVKILEDTRQVSEEFLAIWVTDPEGRVLASTHPQYQDMNFADDLDFLRGRRADHLGRPRVDGSTCQAYLVGPARLADQLVGVVMVQLDVSELQALLNNTLGLGEKGTVLIGRFDGTRVQFLFPPAGLGPGEPSQADSSDLVRAVRGDDGGGRSMLFGKPVLEAHVPVEYSPDHEAWGLVALVDRREAYRPVARLGWLLVVLEFILVTTGVAASFLVARRFTRPILRMADTAAAISAGHLGAQVAVRSRDEIGVLATAMNGMSTRLAAVQEELEQRVQRRTRQLALANRELELARTAAEDASRAKSAFLASMSHEIRNPLNALLGMTDLVLETQLTIAQREYLETVQESGETLLTVINDVLDFSKIEAGKLDLESADFDLHDWLVDTARLLAVRAHAKGLELVCGIQPGTPRTLCGDAGRLRQILINLIGNAIKFTDRGEVVVRVRQQTRTSDQVRLEFEVSDTGVGVPEARQRDIFAAFEQADNSTARRFGGTGLGLAIASQLVKLMGGDIRIESQPDHGSRFCFTALFQPTTDERQLDEPLDPRLAALRMLVVDDHPKARQVFQEQVAAWGLDPVLVADVPEALWRLRSAAAEGQPFDVLVCDAVLSGTDGFQLVELLRADSELAATGVIMLTLGHDPRDVQRCESLAVAARLTKPVKFSDLRKSLVAIAPTLASSAGASDRLSTSASKEVPTSQPAEPPAHAPPNLPSLRILLAEDSAVNQRLAVALLERAGHQVTVAGDGREAVRQVQQNRFDVVLMDVQMPGMDGFEATRQIREAEQSTGDHLPIVAITAHALKGYREKCLEAGMDDYVSKPIRTAQLFAAIRSVLEGSNPPAGSESSTGPLTGEPATGEPATGLEAQPEREPVDIQAALELLGGRQHLCRELARIAIEEAPRLLDEVERAIADRDAEAAGLAAHTLSGSVRYFEPGASAQAGEPGPSGQPEATGQPELPGTQGRSPQIGPPRVAALAEQLERLVKQGQFDRCASIAAQLRTAMERVLRVLLDYTSSPEGGSR